jgi:hypothetical protein
MPARGELHDRQPSSIKWEDATHRSVGCQVANLESSVCVEGDLCAQRSQRQGRRRCTFLGEAPKSGATSECSLAMWLFTRRVDHRVPETLAWVAADYRVRWATVDAPCSLELPWVRGTEHLSVAKSVTPRVAANVPLRFLPDTAKNRRRGASDQRRTPRCQPSIQAGRNQQGVPKTYQSWVSTSPPFGGFAFPSRFAPAQVSGRGGALRDSRPTGREEDINLRLRNEKLLPTFPLTQAGRCAMVARAYIVERDCPADRNCPPTAGAAPKRIRSIEATGAREPARNPSRKGSQ